MRDKEKAFSRVCLLFGASMVNMMQQRNMTIQDLANASGLTADEVTRDIIGFLSTNYTKDWCNIGVYAHVMDFSFELEMRPIDPTEHLRPTGEYGGA